MRIVGSVGSLTYLQQPECCRAPIAAVMVIVMDSQAKDAGEVGRARSQGSSTVLADKAMEAAERLGLDPASDVVNAARDAARAVDEAMDRAGLTFCDPGAESPEADRLCRFTVESPGADLMSQAVGARRRMLLAATGEILARKWALSGGELLFVRGIQTALEVDLEWSGQGVGKIDQHRLGNILRSAKRRS